MRKSENLFQLVGAIGAHVKCSIPVTQINYVSRLPTFNSNEKSIPVAAGASDTRWCTLWVTPPVKAAARASRPESRGVIRMISAISGRVRRTNLS
ncbi:unnamed protein product [Plutella xylostella]|uniref:(diamondback moth) hypothetical protein n=1 Tax=Plutella xylostella TaxID=51655 RepID=A0A8S4G0L6_PLUXY|nr:unnamed protein product [Plutella xylostella]